MPSPVIPSVSQLYWPTICALRQLGGPGTVGEIVETVIELEAFSEEQQAVPHTQGTRTKLEYRLAWARTHLTRHPVERPTHEAGARPVPPPPRYLRFPAPEAPLTYRGSDA